MVWLHYGDHFDPLRSKNNQLINISNILLVHTENAKHCKSEYNLMIPAKTIHS